jgi:hypothetical protein
MKFSKPFVLAAICGAALSLAPKVHAQEIRTTQTQPNRAMLSSGAFALGVPYVSSVIVAAESDHPGDHNLYVPVAGPWMDLADRHCPTAGPCNHEGLYKGLLIGDGILQGIGALEIVSAFLFPETVTTREATRRAPSGATTATVKFTPTFTSGSLGVAALGAF